jgi:hypothetical protein
MYHYHYVLGPETVGVCEITCGNVVLCGQCTVYTRMYRCKGMNMSYAHKCIVFCVAYVRI